MWGIALPEDVLKHRGFDHVGTAMSPASPPQAATAVDHDMKPTVFLLHFLGGSAREWSEVTALLAGRFRCVAIDLPGFGDAAGRLGYGVAAMADAVSEAVRAAKPQRWVLVGHSMGAKVATVVARRAEDGAEGLAGLSHLVLLAGSPPAPEPMDETRRKTMKSWFSADGDASRTQAQSFIDANVGQPLPPALNAQAVDDVLRTRRAAWLAWLEGGSLEDWVDRVGVLRTPAAIVAGEKDADLGSAAQARLMARHFGSPRLSILTGAGHLLPLERPAEVARLILDHAGGVAPGHPAGPVLDPGYLALIESDRVSARTRDILLERGRPDDPSATPAALTAEAFAVLRAVVDRVVPQPDERRIAIAARLDTMLASGEGDGWRFALLPPDAEAYRIALRTLQKAARAAHGCDFESLDGRHQDGLLERAAEGQLVVSGADADEPSFSARQMKLWFEDLRGDAVKIFVAHPATLARMGYSGIANGGDGERKQGFVLVAAGEREPWEPEARSGVSP